MAVDCFTEVSVDKLKLDGIKGVLIDADGTMGPHHTRKFSPEVVDHVKESMIGFDGIPSDVDYEFTGEVAEQEANMNFLLGALATALGLIVFLLVLQFNSISNPLIILLSILA